MAAYSIATTRGLYQAQTQERRAVTIPEAFRAITLGALVGVLLAASAVAVIEVVNLLFAPAFNGALNLLSHPTLPLGF